MRGHTKGARHLKYLSGKRTWNLDFLFGLEVEEGVGLFDDTVSAFGRGVDVLHDERGVAYGFNTSFDVVNVTGDEWDQEVDFDMADGNHKILGLKPLLPSVADKLNVLFKDVVSDVEDVAKKHDASRVCFAELNSDLSFVDFHSSYIV